jgi:eukaryotic-like serine/threonine-protein kinase
MASHPDQLGPYTIDREIGRGGMGVVYLGRDSRLDRDVAIKALPEHFASDPDRLARFEREARTLASLSHPNVAGIYGVEEHDGAKYLILEYVEGETLADRLDRGPMEADEALELASQIAAGTEAAHEQGVIHRDLKPGNIIVTPVGDAKVLDFGLARVEESSSSSTGMSQDPTITTPAIQHSPTIPGAILGTAAYMSPEQARGRKVDKRTDIWSFGVILYEMLIGASPFRGETVSDSIGAVLHKEVDLDRLPADTPAMVRHVLRRCLDRDKTKRYHDIGDVRLDLQEAIAHPDSGAQSVGGRRRVSLVHRAAWPIIAVLAIITGSLAWSQWFTSDPAPAPPRRLLVDLGVNEPLNMETGPHFAISPDGSMLVFSAGDAHSLFLRSIDALTATPLVGTDGAEDPFWSPDGQWIGFFQNNKLKKITVSGGAPLILCDATGNHRGGTWGENDTIVFAPTTTTGLFSVPASGGEPKAITQTNSDAGERSHRWPHFLPGGRRVLFVSQLGSETFDEATIEVVDLDTLARTVILKGGSYPLYSSSGHLIYGSNGTIYAAPFDAKSLTVRSMPSPVLAGVVTQNLTGGVNITIAHDGTFVYNAGESTAPVAGLSLIDRKGDRSPITDEERPFMTVAESPDGARLAVTKLPEDGGPNASVWLYDIERRTLSRLSFNEGISAFPQWSANGARVVYAAGSGVVNLFTKRSDGAGTAQRLLTSDNAQYPSDWADHANIIVYNEESTETSWNILVLDLDQEDPQPQVFLRTPFYEGNAKFSPDGRWLAYDSDESGKQEVYVRPFPGPGGRWQVSTGGGEAPFWNNDGSELYYLNDERVMGATISTTGEALSIGRASLLFEYKLSRFAGSSLDHIEMAADGEHFVALTQSDDQLNAKVHSLTFVFNWFTELNAKAPR